jgi:hypothetical protein
MYCELFCQWRRCHCKRSLKLGFPR